MIGVELRLVQYRFSVFVVVAQEGSFNVMVFSREGFSHGIWCGFHSRYIMRVSFMVCDGGFIHGNL